MSLSSLLFDSEHQWGQCQELYNEKGRTKTLRRGQRDGSVIKGGQVAPPNMRHARIH